MLHDWLVFSIVWDTNKRYCTFPDLKGKFSLCGKLCRNKTNKKHLKTQSDVYKTQIRSLDSPVENSSHCTLNKLTLTVIIQDGLARFLLLAQLFPQLQSEETRSSLFLCHRTLDRQHFPTLQVLFNCHLPSLPCYL